MENRNKTKNNFFWLIAVLIISSVFRLTSLDLIEFKYDEALNVLHVENYFIDKQIRHDSGLSSSGMHNFPLLHYLLVAISIVSTNPQYLSFVIAFLNVILIAIFFVGVKKHYGLIVALTSSLLLASSPWAILYSRKIWHPDLILLFAIPSLLLTIKLINKPEVYFKKSLFVLFLLLTLLTQLHFSGIYFLLVTIILLLVNRVKIFWSTVILGIMIGSIPVLPYLFYNLASSPTCVDCHAYIKYLQTIKEYQIENIFRPWQILSGLYFEDALGADYRQFLRQYSLINYLNVLFLAYIPILVSGSLISITKGKKYILFSLYWVVPAIIYFLTKNPARMYYFVIALPGIVLSSALLFNWLYTRKYLFIKIAGGLLFVSLVFANMYFYYSFNQYLAEKRLINGNYGPVYVHTQEYLNQHLQEYLFRPDYSRIRIYGALFAHSQHFHTKLGEYFMNIQQIDIAEKEFLQAVKDNNDLTALSYLALINYYRGELVKYQEFLHQISLVDPIYSAEVQQKIQSSQVNN